MGMNVNRETKTEAMMPSFFNTTRCIEKSLLCFNLQEIQIIFLKLKGTKSFA